MKLSDVMAMEAGPELNILVAENVRGWKRRKPTHGTCCTCQDCGWANDEACLCDFEPSTEIASAWELVEHCKAHGGKPILWWDPDTRLWKANLGYEEDGSGIMSEAETAPLAICRASLLAVEGE